MKSFAENFFQEDLAEIKVVVGKLRTYDDSVVIMIKRLLQKYIKPDDANNLMDLLEDSFLPIHSRATMAEYWKHLYMDRDQCNVLHSNGAKIGYQDPHSTALTQKICLVKYQYPMRFLKRYSLPYGSVNEE